MSSQLSYRLHGREHRPKTLRKHYRDELDTGQVKASAKEPRACPARRLVMGRSQFSARAPTASSGALTVAASLCLNLGVFDDRPPFLGVGLHERAERRPQIGAAGCLAILWCLSRSSASRRSGNVPGCLATWNSG